MTERIDKVAAVVDLARRIAAGEMSEADSALSILQLVYACSDEASQSMADAILNRRREAA